MSAAGNIYDLGYQRYEGRRGGRLAVAMALLAHTLRSAYGIGRGGRAKVVPFTLLTLAVLPALLAVGIRALASQVGAGADLGDASPIRHDSYQGLTSSLVMLFGAAQAPELFGRDQRYGVLPLYFSRVLTRTDYALARTAGFILAVLIICLLPQLVLTIGGILAAADPAAGLADEAADIPRALAVSLIAAGLLGGIAAVIAAWTPRRAYATAGIIAVFIIPPIVVGIVAARALGDVARWLVLVSPGDVLDGANAAIFGSIPDSAAVASADLAGRVFVLAAALGIAASLAIILRRYQRISV
ncbi:MAG: hypothetical protein H0U58_01240 [Chloroflexi bacterium]|nr:hypothetical protein [Chloroflexota bacterium]